MKVTLSTNDIVARLLDDKNARWSIDGAFAIADYLEHLEEETGEEMEFDRVEIRCDFSEYTDATEAAVEHGCELEDATAEEQEEIALAWLQDRTTVISFNGGVIVQQF